MIHKIASGEYRGQAFDVFEMRAGAYRMTVSGLGATIMTLWVPDAAGNAADVVLGYDDPMAYMKEGGYYYGALIGRVGNRIKMARFELDGKTVEVSMNKPNTSLHGGNEGFDRKVFAAQAGVYEGKEALILTATSPDGEEGYPGDLALRVVYYLTADGDLGLAYEATTNAPTAISLTNHSYFNLAGHDSGSIHDHELWLDAQWYTPMDEDFNATGEIASVSGTPLDFTHQRRIGDRIDGHPIVQAAGGYDHNFVLKTNGKLALIGRVSDPKSGRTMQILTDCPGVQFYSANFVKDDPGKNGARYQKQSALCLETQNFPSTVNYAHFGCSILRPGQVYKRTTIYRFGQ